MLNPEDVISAEVPPANVIDIRRFWELGSKQPTDSGVSFSVKAISQVCESESADPVAVWARTTLIEILLRQGLLEEWRENDTLRAVVFEAAAAFPLPDGLQGLNSDDFIAVLTRDDPARFV